MSRIERNEVGPDDVEFELRYCGVCHTDVHIANNDMGSTNYPCVPGHELAGVVTKVQQDMKLQFTGGKTTFVSQVGKNVQKVKIGDEVGVGCIADSCLSCPSCEDGEENYCQKGMTMTYDTKISHGHLKTNTGYTFGGYSERMTVMQDFVIKASTF